MPDGSPCQTGGIAPVWHGRAPSRSAEEDVRTADLLHELVSRHAKADDRDPQYPFSHRDSLVLPQCIIDRIECQSMMSAVDLDDETNLVPRDVEVNRDRPGRFGPPDETDAEARNAVPAG